MNDSEEHLRLERITAAAAVAAAVAAVSDAILGWVRFFMGL